MVKRLFTLISTVFILLNTQAYTADYITNVGGGNHYNGQRGQYFNGKTYFIFGGGGDNWLDPMIMSYNHKTALVQGPVKIGENPLSAENDFHGNPGMVVDNDGYIHVIWGGHGSYSGEQKYARSTAPENITSWTYLNNIEPESTYPNLLTLSDGTIFLFYRDGNHRDSWVYQTSTDNGDSWSQKVEVLVSGAKRNDGIYFEENYYDSWYATRGVYKGQNDTIHIIFSYHACANDWGKNYHLQRRVNMYYIKITPDEKWLTARGTQLPHPITREVAENKCRIYESEIKKGENIVYSVYPNSLDSDSTDKPYISMRVRLHPNYSVFDGEPKFLKWSGNMWELFDSRSAGQVIVISPNDIEIYRACPTT